MLKTTSADALIHPDRVFSRAEILARPCPVPRVAGIYAWFFKDVPPDVPTEGCIRHAGLTLLYVGISPTKASTKGTPASGQTLQSRLRSHMNGNAEGSTLRLSLGCLLSEQLGIRLQRVGSGKRLTFSEKGEPLLSEWMGANAFVAWMVDSEPWLLETQLIGSLTLPLNLEGNSSQPFTAVLSEVRQAARANALLLPVLGH